MKLKNLLVTAPGSLIKTADIESPDEVQLENDFANMAFVFLRDRAPALQPHLLGFEVVDREEDGSRAIGIFGFKVSGNYYYVPVFFVNNQIKGMDLLFSKKTNSFMPLRETWINHILDQGTLRLGEGASSNKVREDFESPNFDFLSSPPSGTKMGSAGLEYLFSDTELRKMAMGVQPETGAMQTSLMPGIGGATQGVNMLANAGSAPDQPAPPTPPSGSLGAGQPAASVEQPPMLAASGLELPGNVGGNADAEAAGAAATPPKAAAWNAGQGHEEWNLIQATVKEGMHNDADFRMALAGAMAQLQHVELQDMHKTADGSPLLTYMAQVGGPRAVDAVLRTVRGSQKYANALLEFYPDVQSIVVEEFSADLAPVKQAASITVVSKGDSDCCCCDEGGSDDKAMTSAEKKRLVRDGFSIIDRRPEDTRSETFDIAYQKEYCNPTESGRYELLLPTGSAADAWILQCKGGPGAGSMIAVQPDSRFYFTADSQRVFVRGGLQTGESPYDAAVSCDSIEAGNKYVLVNEKGDASAPFSADATIAESGERVRIKVNFESYVDHEAKEPGTWRSFETSGVYDHTQSCDYLQLADHPGSKLTTAGDALVVPTGWKALKLVSKSEYTDIVAPTTEDGPYPSEARDTARETYSTFKPGNPIDVEEALGKNAIHKLTIESPDAGTSYFAHLNGFTDGPWNYKQAMVQLVGKYGMDVDDVEQRMMKASRDFKDRCLIKVSQYGGVGVGINMPQDSSEIGSDPDTGAMMQQPFVGTEQGEFLGAPPLEQDPTRPGFAVGGQAEQELGAGGGGAEMDAQLGDDAIGLAEQAAQSGQKHVFDHATIGGLAKLYDASAAIDTYLPDLQKALDRLGRILFIFYWKNEDFAERFGSEDLAEMEDLLRGVFKSYGDLVLKLEEKSVVKPDAQEVLSI